jgi:alkaline phosphatase
MRISLLHPRAVLLRTRLLFLFLLVAGCGGKATQTPTSTPPAAGLPPTETAAIPTEPAPAPPRYIILFIGDGMGANHRQAAALSRGTLVMDTLAIHGWQETASLTSTATDSAAGATAMATGRRTGNYMVGVTLVGQPIETILELARQQGLSAGLVTTDMLSGATPAAFAAHHISRQAYDEISLQIAESGVEVLLGGGEAHFLPPDAPTCHPAPGERTDGRNLVDEMVTAGYTYICDADTLAALDTSASTHLLGLFTSKGYPDDTHFPPLEQMTRTALEILARDPEGFFLMVEGAQIDWASHDNDPIWMLQEMAGLDRSVAAAVEFSLVHPDTLIIVAADHETGGLQINLQVTGAAHESGPYLTIDNEEFYLHWLSGSHTEMNVPVTAQGPGADRLAGTHHLTRVYDAMIFALNAQ